MVLALVGGDFKTDCQGMNNRHGVILGCGVLGVMLHDFVQNGCLQNVTG